ncbi:LacI family transcriptional regulator [Candidatus Hakubella thermalkaliphila]|uniref:LacI family transcriptional regulator n=1 Tax=Candidatus Hakubella thermalkaliphila TaxID=2754717 RepID=A0A6V8P021_9ACTN|nr:LacI family transcriptional regulator [Candidatus Hakubella thermalkaliphila]
MARITIKDVAKLADVSLGTVSAILNNQGRISKETRQRVLEVVNKLDYVPQYAARSLKAKKKGALGLATFWDFELMSSKYFREIVQGITSVTSELGYKLHLINLEQTDLEERGLQTLASDGSLDGIFFLAPTVSQLILIKAALRKFPFVIIGASVKDPKVSFVDSDNYEGGPTSS